MLPCSKYYAKIITFVARYKNKKHDDNISKTYHRRIGKGDVRWNKEKPNRERNARRRYTH